MESILSQSFRDFEVLAIDDGSTDASTEMLAEFESRDPRVRVYRRDGEGVIAALNYGCGLVRSQYVARMDADDVAHPERLERQLAFLHENPEVVLLGTGHSEIDENGTILGTTIYPSSIEDVAARLPVKNCLAHPTVVFSRAVFEELGGYRIALRHAEDYDLWLRMGDRHPIANLAEPLLAYRVHPHSVSVANQKQQTLSTLAARAATQLRRSGVDDGLSSETVVTHEVLEHLGVSRAEVARHVFATCSGRAEWALASGQDRLALDFCADALKAGDDAGLTRAERAHVHRIATIAALNERLLPDATRSLVRGIAARPFLTVGILRRALRIATGRIRNLLNLTDGCSDV